MILHSRALREFRSSTRYVSCVMENKLDVPIHRIDIYRQNWNWSVAFHVKCAARERGSKRRKGASSSARSEREREGGKRSKGGERSVLWRKRKGERERDNDTHRGGWLGECK